MMMLGIPARVLLTARATGAASAMNNVNTFPLDGYGFLWGVSLRCKQCNSSIPSQDILIHGIILGRSAIQISQIEIDSKLLQAVGDILPIRGIKSRVRHRGVILQVVLSHDVRECDTI